MFGKSVTNSSDRNEAILVAKRALFEKNRLKRVFNVRERLIGLDVPAIQEQITEKKARKEFNKDMKLLYDSSAVQLERRVIERDNAMNRMRRARNLEVDNYRFQYQRFQDRREFDLNNPNRLKETRSVADHLKLGPASMQVFSGDDCQSKNRRVFQRAQQRAWLDQQIDEREKSKKAKMEDLAKYNSSLTLRNQRVHEMAIAETKTRQSIASAIADYNVRFANKQREQRERRAIENREDNQVEIDNMLKSKILSETQVRAKFRTLMTGEELAQFRKEQDEQFKLNKKNRDDAKIMDAQIHQDITNANRKFMALNAHVEQVNKELTREHFRINKDMGKVQYEREQQSRRARFDEHATAEFYAQFNKSSR